MRCVCLHIHASSACIQERENVWSRMHAYLLCLPEYAHTHTHTHTVYIDPTRSLLCQPYTHTHTHTHTCVHKSNQIPCAYSQIQESIGKEEFEYVPIPDDLTLAFFINGGSLLHQVEAQSGARLRLDKAESATMVCHTLLFVCICMYVCIYTHKFSCIYTHTCSGFFGVRDCVESAVMVCDTLLVYVFVVLLCHIHAPFTRIMR
jgi:hypothetical protein